MLMLTKGFESGNVLESAEPSGQSLLGLLSGLPLHPSGFGLQLQLFDGALYGAELKELLLPLRLPSAGLLLLRLKTILG